MEGRKLQLAGGSTYLVSLPKRWVTGAGLKAGDTLFVDTTADGSVTVRHRPADKPNVRRKIFEERGEEARDHLLRKLIGAYVSGFGLIEVRYPPGREPFVRRVAREFCRLVVGPEVIEESRNFLIIQDLSDPSELSSEKCLRRMHLLVRAMIEDAVRALRTSSGSLAHEVSMRDQDVDRLSWMVAKQYHLAHTGNGEAHQRNRTNGIHTQVLVAKLLERIGDHAERIAHAVPTIAANKPLDEKLMHDLEVGGGSAVAILDQAFRALVTRDIDEANRAIDAQSEHQRLIDALFHRAALRKGEELLALSAVVDSLSRTASYATDIAEQAINLAVLSEPAPD